jgi:transcriptional regulator with XRE-family HTH domain
MAEGNVLAARSESAQGKGRGSKRHILSFRILAISEFTSKQYFHYEAMVFRPESRHNVSMSKARRFRRTFIREWRKYRGLTLEKVADRLDMTPGHISMLERGQRGYTQETLEAVASALQTDVASLLMRDPTDPDAIWSIWDQAKPGQRRQIVEIAKTLVKTGT